MTVHRTRPPTRVNARDPRYRSTETTGQEALEAYRAPPADAVIEVAAHHRTATPETFALHIVAQEEKRGARRERLWRRPRPSAARHDDGRRGGGNRRVRVRSRARTLGLSRVMSARLAAGKGVAPGGSTKRSSCRAASLARNGLGPRR